MRRSFFFFSFGFIFELQYWFETQDVGLPQAYSCGPGTIFWNGFDGFHSYSLPFPHFLGSRWDFLAWLTCFLWALCHFCPVSSNPCWSPWKWNWMLLSHVQLFCDHMDYTVHRFLQTRILEWVAFPFQGIFPTQGLNPGLLNCRQILYQLSHKGSPAGHLRRWPNLSKLFYSVISHLFLFFLHL